MHCSKINLRLDYHQLRIKSDNIPKITFRATEGHYEILLMSLEITNTLTTFMNLINRVFKSFLDPFMIVYINDILVYPRN